MIELALKTIEKIEKNGYEAYLVGGCVRDLLMGKEAHDFDITTNALPVDILKIFPDAKYENDFGTVILAIKDKNEKVLTVLEITTYRSESTYRDHRRPDEVVFEKELDKDLARRDFTINSMAIRPIKKDSGKYDAIVLKKTKNILLKTISKDLELVDLYGGLKDIKLKIIRAVGEPSDRFKEDALRMMRAIRFSSQLGFELEPKTERAIIKILSSNNSAFGIDLLNKTKLLQYIIPELLYGKDLKQNHHHIYTVYKHNLLSLKYCPSSKWQVRFASLLHDIGKPKSMKIINGQTTFYNHEYIGAKIVKKIMLRLKFSNQDTDMVVNLVKNHMFYYNVGEVTATSVRRLISKTGKENLKDLIDLRVADRLGSGTPKAMPYKLRHLQYMMEKVQNDPVSVKMLKIDGCDLMSYLKIEAGPKIGAILDVLLAEVLDNPDLNIKKKLLEKASDLNKMNLSDLRSQAKELIEEKREEEDLDIKKKFKV